MAVRNGVALLAVLLTLLLGVRPLIKALKRDPAAAKPPPDAADDDAAEDEDAPRPEMVPAQDPQTGVVDPELLGKQVGLAQQLVREKPDTAVAALRQMLKDPEAEPA
jgi:flagellar M-ring protein FliF